MRYARLAVLAMTLGLGLCAAGQAPTRIVPKGDAVSGKKLFHQNCSICHGEDATGNGSMYDPESAEPERRIPPSDLSALSLKDAGVFPADRVREAMYDTRKVKAHGTPEMPAWGHAFDSYKSSPKRVDKWVEDITAWLASIQRK